MFFNVIEEINIKIYIFNKIKGIYKYLWVEIMIKIKWIKCMKEELR